MSEMLTLLKQNIDDVGELHLSRHKTDALLKWIGKMAEIGREFELNAKFLTEIKQKIEIGEIKL